MKNGITYLREAMRDAVHIYLTIRHHKNFINIFP